MITTYDAEFCAAFDRKIWAVDFIGRAQSDSKPFERYRQSLGGASAPRSPANGLSTKSLIARA